ncbi:nuclease-related domain-containing protein [Petrachloros mirabilis]
MNVSAWKSKSHQEHRRHPLKNLPLRLPGQSNEERVKDLQDQVLDHLVVPTVLVTLAMFEWWHWWFGNPPIPWVLTIPAIVAVIYTWFKVVAILPKIKNLRLGRDGERVVAEFLEPLRAKGYRVFHDLPGDGFNIDHVIVGPAGVFTIETKTRSKPSRGCSCIVYDGETVRIGNGAPTDEHLIQARAQARWLAGVLNDGRVATVVVRPVLLFPEWYVERTATRNKEDVWVLNPKALEKFLSSEPAILSFERIDSVSNTLTRHCRQLAA